MPAIGLNHVSVHVRRLDESVSFYRDVLGLEPVATPRFGAPAQWLRVGSLQLHLFEREAPAPRYHHFGLAVDDFEGIYRRAEQAGVLDAETYGHHLFELPGGCVQLYVRDPAGNLVELCWPEVSTLPPEIARQARRLADEYPQGEEGMRATLFLASDRAAAGL